MNKKNSDAKNKELKISELRYRRLFETAQDGILLVDFETGMILDANQFLIDLLGYSKANFLGKHLWEVGVFKDIAASKKNFLTLQKKRYVRFEDLPLETKTGKKIDVEFISNVYKVGDVKVIQCNIRDITDRKKAEYVASVSELRYRRLFETAQDGILLVDFETGMILDANQFLIDLLGYSKAKFLGKHLWEVGVFKDIAASKKNFLTLQKKRYVRFEDLPLETKTGKKIDVEFISNAYRVDGTTIIQCNIRNITDRRNAENLLKESETALNQLFENMSSAVAVYEAKNNGKDFIIKNFNRAAEKIENVKRSRIIGKNILKVFPGVKDFGLFKVFQRVWKTGKPEYFPISLYSDKRIIGWRENYIYKLNDNDIVATYNDVTERKAVEEQLQQSEEKFSKAFLISPYAIGITRAKDGSFVDVNDAFISIIGYTKKEILAGSSTGLKIWVNEKDRNNMISDLRAGRPVIRKEYQFRTKSGKIITGLFSAQIIKLNQEQFVLSNMVDITERKKAEDAIKKEQVLSKAIIDSIPGTFYVLDEKGFYVHWNAYQRDNIVGKPESQVHLTNAINTIHPDDRTLVGSRIANVLINGKEETVEGRVLMHGGPEFKWFLMTGQRMIVGGKPLLVGIGIDITDRKKAEKQVSEIKNMDEAILDSIGDAVFASDIDGKIILFNKIAEDITGISAKEAIGSNYKKIINFVSEKDGKPTNDFISEAIKNNKITKMANHVLLVRKDGGKIPVADSAAPIKDINGNIIGCVVVFRDVTKERDVDKAKTEFASLASHQLRTPTTSINWYSEMLLDEEVGPLSKKQKEYIKEIHHGNQRMIDLMDALLNVSQIELGTFMIQTKPTDIAIITDDVLGELKTQINGKELEIGKKYEKNACIIKSDQRLIRIIVQNLLSNAVAYTHPKGRISIKIEKKNNCVKIGIKDNGYGIPQSARPKIYTKFFRADNALSVKPDGTGLGLYITKSIVDALDGTISFKSKEGVGTTFSVNIPDKIIAKKSKKI